MELVIKRYEELTLDELYEILRVRVAVFVVEQACPYQEIDGRDADSIHIFLRDSDGIKAYLRVFLRDASSSEAIIGRVIALKRRCGLASRLLSEGIRVAKEQLRAETISIEAQSYARTLYEKVGFRQIADEYVDSGIPHIPMKLDLTTS